MVCHKSRIHEEMTVSKKPLLLVLPYLKPLSLQIKTKLRKSLTGILYYVKLQILFKSQNKLSKAFCFIEDYVPKELRPCIVLNPITVNVSDILM